MITGHYHKIILLKMGLLVEQVKKLAKERPRKKEIELGIWHQDRLKFHTETVLLKSELSPYYNEYIDWIGSEEPELLPSEKIARFKQLMTVPLSTIGLTEAIQDSLERVFDGQDAFNRYDFDDSEKEAEWEEVRDSKFWQTQGVEAMMNAIDSVWVVDNKDGEHCNLLIDISTVIDINTDKDGDCHWVIFAIGEKLFVYDDEAITTYEYKQADPRSPVEIGAEIDRFVHDLGYCPARMFWSKFIRKSNPVNHQAPLTNVLGDLDWLLTHATFKKYMDIANSFPILVTYDTDDDSEDLTREKNIGRTGGNKETSGGSLIGSGSIIKVPAPRDNEPDLMNNPVKYINPDVDTLKFHVEETSRLWDQIYLTVVGADGEQKNDMAKNEKQVLASFESQGQILRNIAENFEIIIAFAEKTLIALKYGIETEPSIDLGSKFFLKTTGDLVEEMEEVKSNDILHDALNTELLDIKFRNDKMGRTRANIILDLDPLPGRTMEQAKEILDSDGITVKIYRVKANLMSFIRRFEREQLPLEQFIREGDYNKKINLIKGKFNDYESEFEQGNNDQGQGQRSLSHIEHEDQSTSGGPETSVEDNLD